MEVDIVTIAKLPNRIIVAIAKLRNNILLINSSFLKILFLF